MTYRRTLAGVAALGAAFLMSAAHSQHALDKLLESEPAGKPRQTSNIDSSVTESANRGHEALQDKVRGVEQVKRNLSGGAPSTGAKETPAKQQQAGAGTTSFVCDYKCTTNGLLGSDKSSMSIVVQASDVASAQSEAVRYGESNCFKQTRRVFDTGSARCRKQ